ncbi:MAG TPA: hypothetical protein VFK78_11495 [Gemmatimonadales bacterium]|nr:hypothetical protein [Gemmatimonadales bacterium]
MRAAVLVGGLVFLAAPLLAQQDSTKTDSAKADSVKAESVATVPAPPTPAQERYLEGLSTAGRGIAQIKSGIARVANAVNSDTARLRSAGRILAGYCATGHGYMSRGRATMDAKAYEDSTRQKARALMVQIDSLLRAAPECEQNAAQNPAPAAAVLLQRIRAYEAALRDFRTAIGLPNRQ